MRWQINAQPRLALDGNRSSSGTFDGISVYRLDSRGKVYQHEVTDVQMRDPVSGVDQWSGASECGGERVERGACGGMGVAACRAGDVACLPCCDPQQECAAAVKAPHPHPLTRTPPHPAFPPAAALLCSQPITNPLLYALNFILSPTPRAQQVPCPGERASKAASQAWPRVAGRGGVGWGRAAQRQSCAGLASACLGRHCACVSCLCVFPALCCRLLVCRWR